MKLPELLADPAQSAPLAERIHAATALGADDPRIGESASIAAGSFLRGSPPGEGQDNEHPQARAATGSYRIDIVPVTVSQIADFIESGAYGDRGLWSEAGWEWRTSLSIERPRFYGEPEWRAYLSPGQPAVGVSWYEADAYARWAGRRLPDELEWERAARGEDGRRYPWGDEWDPARAAHRGGARHTLPVGCFPAGRSPHGLWDCAGNVWEWCAGDGAGAAIAGAAHTLWPARGGAWNAHPPQLRCAHRNAWPAGARFSNIGFRTAR